jgi:hypothetical protein
MLLWSQPGSVGQEMHKDHLDDSNGAVALFVSLQEEGSLLHVGAWHGES